MVDVLNQWAAAWGPYFLLAVIQNAAFLVLVFAALFLLRRAPARVLSLVATLGVIKLIIPPFVSLGWLESTPAEPVAEPVATLLFPFADLGASDEVFASQLTGGFSISALLMMIWASVALTRLGVSLLQTIQLVLDVRGAERIDDDAVPAEILAARMSVWKSDGINLPLTMGVRPRRIFVPPSWDSWSIASRRAVLRHELEHVHRRDGVVQTLEVLVQAVFFFLPPVTWLVRRLHTYREMACDDASVPADPRSRLDYSRFLCSLAESVLDQPPTTATASTLARRKGELLDRVTYQIKEGVVKKSSKKQLLLIVAALLISILPLSLVYGGSSQDQAPPPPPPAKSTETETVAPPPPPKKPAKGEKEIKKTEQEIKKIKAMQGKDVPPPPPKGMKVGLASGEDKILVNGTPVPPKKFKATMESAMKEFGGKNVVIIDGDKNVTMDQLHAVQADLNDLGLTKVKYTGALAKGVKLVLPPAKAQKKLEQMDPDKIVHVHVYADGTLTLDGEKIIADKMPNWIDKLMQEDPDRIVVIHTEPDTRYGALVQTLDAVRKGGATKISLADPGV